MVAEADPQAQAAGDSVAVPEAETAVVVHADLMDQKKVEKTAVFASIVRFVHQKCA